jgi:Raf kinase inhibitor-like YbhB/YbcL family protein
MRLTSTAFPDGGSIPKRYTCDGANVSPPLTVVDVPVGALSLALVVEDPDAPRGTWDHWVLYDMDVTSDIREGATTGTPGRNSWGRTGYGGPCPPDREHRYVFTVYAVDTFLALPKGVDKHGLRRELVGHTVAEAGLMGRYVR